MNWERWTFEEVKFMKKYTVAALVLLISIMFFAVISFAQAVSEENKKGSEKPAMDKAPKIKAMQFTGMVSKVDGALVSVKNKKGMMKTFDAAGAKLKGYKDIAGIKIGDVVRITYEEADGKMTAIVVAKTSAKVSKVEIP
jgi:hypothetical protein